MADLDFAGLFDSTFRQGSCRLQSALKQKRNQRSRDHG
jgi:hypothetical protein